MTGEIHGAPILPALRGTFISRTRPRNPETSVQNLSLYFQHHGKGHYLSQPFIESSIYSTPIIQTNATNLNMAIYKSNLLATVTLIKKNLTFLALKKNNIKKHLTNAQCFLVFKFTSPMSAPTYFFILFLRRFGHESAKQIFRVSLSLRFANLL